MDIFFFFLSIVLILLLIAGLVKPSWVLRRAKKRTRLRVLFYFGIGAIVSTVLWFIAQTPHLCSRTQSLPEMVGTWTGDAPNYIKPRSTDTFPIAITITPEGNVSGRIGDAVIANGTLRRNHTTVIWFGNPRYVVEAPLSGVILPRDSVTTDLCWLVLDVHGNALHGGFSTIGQRGAKKEKQWLVVRNLRLFRS